MELRAVLEERNPLLARAASVGALLVAVAIALDSRAPDVAPDLVLAVIAFGWPVVAALAFAWLVGAATRRAPVTVHADDGRLRLDGRPVARRFTRGHASVLDSGRARVDLGSRFWRHVRLEVDDGAVARELLGELGLDRRSGTSTFAARRVRSYAPPLLTAAVLGVPLCIGFCIVSPSVGLAVLATLWGAVVHERISGRLTVTIGADGIDLRSPFGSEFVPHARVRDVDPLAATVHGRHPTLGFSLLLDDGTETLIDTRRHRLDAETWGTDAVYQAMRSAWLAWRQRAGEPEPMTSLLLARGGRSLDAWLAGLRALGSGEGTGYRLAAVDDEALFATLASASASRELRAAAAVVLGASGRHAARLRVAADDVADPVVRRVALDPAADTALGDLESADGDEAPPGARRTIP